MAKGEITRFEQFLLLSQCFQKTSASDASESVYMRERVNPFPHTTKLVQTTVTFPSYNKSAADDFDKIEGKIWKIPINECLITGKS